MVKNAKRPVSKGVSLWHLSNYREAELLKTIIFIKAFMFSRTLYAYTFYNYKNIKKFTSTGHIRLNLIPIGHNPTIIGDYWFKATLFWRQVRQITFIV